MKIFYLATLFLSLEAYAGSPKVDVCTTAADKVAFCHFDKEDAEWILTLLPQNAVRAHLARHDDAVAGGVTSQTGIQLDAECLPVVTQPQPLPEPEPVPQPADQQEAKQDAQSQTETD